MRLITWNCCRGPYSKKVPLLNSFEADLAVIQECQKPDIETNQKLWFGDNPNQGVLVLSSGLFTLHSLPQKPEVPKFIIPIQVRGPVDFILFAVWAKADSSFPYIQAVVRAVAIYQEHFQNSNCILIGDLNSNAIWDSKHPKALNHSALVKQLKEHGLISAYHHYFSESHGSESQPTYYFQWKELKPYHIDYCFVPISWTSKIQHVEIASYEGWQLYSDHRPLLVEIEN